VDDCAIIVLSGVIFTRSHHSSHGKEAFTMAKHEAGSVLGLPEIDSNTSAHGDSWNLAAGGGVEYVRMSREDMGKMWRM
jgi:hypothetical protein